MRILHVAESVRGGCGTYLNEIVPLQSCALGECNVRVLVPRQHADILSEIAEGTIGMFERRSRVAGLPHLAREVLRQARAFRPDVIHAHSTFAGATVRMLRSFLPSGTAVIYCPHGWIFDVDQPWATRAIARAAERLLSRRAEAIVAISDYEARQAAAIGIDPQKITVVLNGVRSMVPDGMAPWPGDRLRVLFIGRLDRQKGVDVLLDAVASLESAELRVIGDAVHSKSALPKQPRARVAFLGWQNQDAVNRHLRACDVVAMPSRWEGFGLTAVEAMRAAKPVIASNVGGLSEIVVDGVTGLLVPKEDPAALRQAIASRSRDEWRAMGDSGHRRFMERYTVERTHAELLALYRSVARRAEPSEAVCRATT